MDDFRSFVLDILSSLGISQVPREDLTDNELAAIFLNKLNRYMYQSYKVNGETYISPFEYFWEQHHLDILGIRIDDEQCFKVANALEPIYSMPQNYPDLEISPPISRAGISDRAVVNIRFFTAIQDFKISIHKGGRNPYLQYNETPEWFTAKSIVANPTHIHEFLQFLEATQSQGDKRYKWMLEAANYLITDYKGDAYNILASHDGDAGAIREELASSGYLGYSYKKADMFLRDMTDWGIWSYSKNADLVDVASDANTMRVALRTGILRTRFPLLASYMDVYCYQYSSIDSYTAKAWRKVWDKWSEIPKNHRPLTPASIDYLLYKGIGKNTCKLNKRKCNSCILDTICPSETRNLKPPKSISQKGQTGWDSGATDEGGGGGIMS